jgi:tetratricopeptide (TPR) repeat protein
MIRAAALALVLFASSDNPDAMKMLQDWITAVDQHRAGERDPALRTIGAWNHDDLDMMRAYVEAIAELPNRGDRAARRSHISGGDMAKIRNHSMSLQARGNFDRFLKRAAILHTDLALLTFVPEVMAAPKAQAQRPRTQRLNGDPVIDVRSADGRAEDFQRANPHWDFAMDLLEGLPAKPSRDPMVAQWYSTIAAYFARQDNTADGLRHFDRARRVVPDDPGVLYAEAFLQEKLGAPRIQDFARTTTLPNGLTILGVTSPQTHFRRAEEMLRKALTAKPAFHEAGLHLGHVLAEQKKYEAALAELQRVASVLVDPVAIYYAHLFSGDAALALGRGPQSRASYQSALELFPASQAARMGMSAAWRFDGNRQAALDALLVTLNHPPATRDNNDEPWWDYYEGSTERVAQLLDELREPFKGVER